MPLRGPLGALLLILAGVVILGAAGLNTTLTCARQPAEPVTCRSGRTWMGLVALGTQATYPSVRSAEALRECEPEVGWGECVGALRIENPGGQAQTFAGFSEAGAERAAERLNTLITGEATGTVTINATNWPLTLVFTGLGLVAIGGGLAGLITRR
jgi:hypothetical protein